jgi:hypothetical protein
LYVRPGKISDGYVVHWTRKWGTLITNHEGGPGSVEIEPLVFSNPVLPIANAAGMKIVPGRDGWKVFKAWQAFLRATPKSQQMRDAG